MNCLTVCLAAGTVKIILLRLLCLLLLTFALLLLVAGLGKRWRLLVNISDSMPQRVYLLHRTGETPRKNQLVAFIAPENPLYQDGALFLKYIAGVPGDYVSIDGGQWIVAGRILGSIRQFSSGGLPLLPGPTGVIPPGHFAVWSPHYNAYDSRYQDIGWIDAASIIGVVQPLW